MLSTGLRYKSAKIFLLIKDSLVIIQLQDTTMAATALNDSEKERLLDRDSVVIHSTENKQVQ